MLFHLLGLLQGQIQCSCCVSFIIFSFKTNLQWYQGFLFNKSCLNFLLLNFPFSMNHLLCVQKLSSQKNIHPSLRSRRKHCSILMYCWDSILSLSLSLYMVFHASSETGLVHLDSGNIPKHSEKHPSQAHICGDWFVVEPVWTGWLVQKCVAGECEVWNPDKMVCL